MPQKLNDWNPEHRAMSPAPQGDEEDREMADDEELDDDEDSDDIDEDEEVEED